jgi:hypothetical protein
MLYTVMTTIFDKDQKWNQVNFNDKSGLFVMSLSEENVIR